ncbi:IS1380 family transposase [Gordonia sp. ABSL49_1]|uniref:IS1380 family transposase n=1 Tax=unclassified Gordonia (in: high G+C Gram-positive bacteria) TaxID=2657482 RepID=UPI001F1152AE|nr:IS1380 family transposase [Gordonia sp. ABSL49_1]MCH5644861.1 IS1380 family transposase [Gordonia sp. ABSL49_1]
MKVSHTFSAEAAVFDDDNLVSHAGLVPVMELAESIGLTTVLAERVELKTTRVASAAANLDAKLMTVIAGFCCGADSIDDLGVVRAGGHARVFDRVYAPVTVGQTLREFTAGHARQLTAVLTRTLPAMCARANLLPDADARAYIDIDSLLRPVYGYQKQSASYGHTKIAGRELKRKGLSPLVATLSTPGHPPVIANAWLRAGSAASGAGAARMIAETLTTARACGASGEIVVRGDSAYGAAAVMRTCQRLDARFSLVLRKNTAINRAITEIDEHAWTPVHYPGAVTDPDTGELISDAEVAEATYTVRPNSRHPVTARLIVRRVKARHPTDTNTLVSAWRYHPFFTNTTDDTVTADINHRRHAIIETVFADLIDGPLAHLPSGKFGANAAWLALTAISHNLMRTLAALTTPALRAARGATLRRTLVAVPARLARPARTAVLHLPRHWPWQHAFTTLWTALHTT